MVSQIPAPLVSANSLPNLAPQMGLPHFLLLFVTSFHMSVLTLEHSRYFQAFWSGVFFVRQGTIIKKEPLKDIHVA